jgi:hypothetical protein
VHVRFHQILPTTAESNPIWLILTGKDALQERELNFLGTVGSKIKSGKFVRSLFKKANIDLGQRTYINYDAADKFRLNRTLQATKGMGWVDSSRFNSVINEIKNFSGKKYFSGSDWLF